VRESRILAEGKGFSSRLKTFVKLAGVTLNVLANGLANELSLAYSQHCSAYANLLLGLDGYFDG